MQVQHQVPNSVILQYYMYFLYLVLKQIENTGRMLLSVFNLFQQSCMSHLLSPDSRFCDEHKTQFKQGLNIAKSTGPTPVE